MTTEIRFAKNQVEVRSQGDKSTIEGYAAVFDALSQNLGGFQEVIRRGAFTKTVQEADVRALLNHDRNFVLGRTKSGTLKVSEDDTGLYYEIDAPNTSYARDLLESISRGDIDQSSFAFSVVGKNGERWDYTESGFPLRELLEVKLVDVSPVTSPAYLDTTVALGERSLVALCEARGLDVQEFAQLRPSEAVRAILEGAESIVDVSFNDDSEEEREAPLSLANYRARLQLMAHGPI